MNIRPVHIRQIATPVMLQQIKAAQARHAHRAKMALYARVAQAQQQKNARPVITARAVLRKLVRPLAQVLVGPMRVQAVSRNAMTHV